MSASDAARCQRALDLLAETLDARGARGWLVGGCLRDALLSRPVRDVDVALTCDPLPFARSLPHAVAHTAVPLNRDSVRMFLHVDPHGDPLQIDLSPLHPPDDTLVSPADTASARLPTIESDLARRDFRVNAMALPLAARHEFLALIAAGASNPAPDVPLLAPDQLIDPLGGYADLQSRILNLASSHALSDDPGRILRAARLVADAGFTLSPALIQRAREAAHQLAMLPGDRLRDELSPLLTLPRAAEGVAALAEMDALPILIPGLTTPEQASHAIASLRAVACLQDGGQPPVMTEPLEPLAALDALDALDALRAWYAAPLRPHVPRLAALRWALLVHAAASHAPGDQPLIPAQRELLANREGFSPVPVPCAGLSRLRAPDANDAPRFAITAILRVPLPTIEQTIIAAASDCAAWRERLADAMPTAADLRHLFAARGAAMVDLLVAAAACNAALASLTESPLPGARSSPHVAERVRDILAIYFTDRNRLDPPPLLTGADLLAALALPPGPIVGGLLRRIRAAQLDGAIASRDEAMALARRLVSGR